MKIALISYEYPPDTAYGGIATYIYQAAKMMYQRGHHVEVFAGSSYRYETKAEDGIVVHRINEQNRLNFSKHIGEVFERRHNTIRFDVAEGPEFNAEASEAIRLVPNIPLVIKLHSPGFVAYQLNSYGIPLMTRVYKDLRALRWGMRDKYMTFKWIYKPQCDAEYIHALEADEITVPSKSLSRKVIRAWSLDSRRVSYIPNAYQPRQDLLNIPADTQTNVVTFIGRLEIRKGILDLVRAIPTILKEHPQTKFRFVGGSTLSHSGEDMRQYLERELLPYHNALEFTGSVPPEKIPSILAATDICVFPSIWENFPYVCLEAMASARGVISSNAGGMGEMIESKNHGRLVPPRSPQKIAKAVIELLKDPEMRMALGEAARDRVLKEYNFDKIGILQENSYNIAIARRNAIGIRHKNS